MICAARLFSHRDMTTPYSPLPRWHHTLVDISGLGVVCYGGRTIADSTPPGFLGDINIFTGGSWQTGTTNGIAKAEHAAAYDGTAMVETMGINEAYYQQDTQTFNSSQSWADRTTNESISYPGVYQGPNSLRGSRMAYVSGASACYLLGGTCSFKRSYPMEVWKWTDAAAWSNFTTVMPMPGRTYFSMAASSSTILIYGGKNQNGPLSDGWTFNPTGGGTEGVWTQVSTYNSTSPGPLYGAAMTYDSSASVYVLYGGVNNFGNYSNQTWLWTPSTGVWTNPNPSNNPGPMAFAGFAFASAINKNLLFGGLNSLLGLGSTWTYQVSNNSWLQLY